jgi:hypothetical protein
VCASTVCGATVRLTQFLAGEHRKRELGLVGNAIGTAATPRTSSLDAITQDKLDIEREVCVCLCAESLFADDLNTVPKVAGDVGAVEHGDDAAIRGVCRRAGVLTSVRAR